MNYDKQQILFESTNGSITLDFIRAVMIVDLE
jgi:hypothetical protein